MINRTLSRRLERLEDQMIPTGEPKVIHVVFINPEWHAGARKFHGRNPCVQCVSASAAGSTATANVLPESRPLMCNIWRLSG